MQSLMHILKPKCIRYDCTRIRVANVRVSRFTTRNISPRVTIPPVTAPLPPVASPQHTHQAASKRRRILSCHTQLKWQTTDEASGDLEAR